MKKKRIIFYSIFIMLIFVGLVFIVIRKQEPIGRAVGVRTYLQEEVEVGTIKGIDEFKGEKEYIVDAKMEPA